MSGLIEKIKRVLVLKWIIEHFAEFALFISLIFLLMIVLLSLYLVPAELKPVVAFAGIYYTVIVLGIIGIMALFNRIQFKMGLRNLIRHKSDSVIAILGFMVGTSIICSSMAIGDTMSNMIEGIIYESYYQYDEYIQVQDSQGNLVYFNGTSANEIADIVWSVNGNESLVDGVSWEVSENGAVIDFNTYLYEPMFNLKAVSPYSFESFGYFTSKGKKVSYDLAVDEVYLVSGAADKIGAEPGHIIQIATRAGVQNFTVKAILDEKERGATFSGASSAYLSFQGIWALFGITPGPEPMMGKDGNWSGGFYNRLLISNEGDKVAGGKLCSKVMDKVGEGLKVYPHPQGPTAEWKFTDDKATSIKFAKSMIDQFSKMFLVLGTFTIIVGVTLILNIFVMLAEERKEEMGISRAVGMKRKHLRRVYLFEGTIYSILSSIVGVFFGAFSGYLIILGLQGIMNSMGFMEFSILEYYTITPASIILSFIAGFTITISTTLFITWRVARLNIVSAIRNIPSPIKTSSIVSRIQRSMGVYDPVCDCGDGSRKARTIERLFDRFTLIGVLSIVLGGGLFYIGLATWMAWSTYLGMSMFIIGFSFILKAFTRDRLAFNLMSVSLLVLWIAPVKIFEDLGGQLEMFILSGVFMVSSSVLLLVWNTDIILWAIEKLLNAVKVSPAAIKMAISYPIKKRFRTGVTIFMFSLIIFTITGLSMIVEIFNVNINALEKDISGGYNLIGISMVNGIDDLKATYERVDPDNATLVNWDKTHSLSYGYLRINYTNILTNEKDEMPYMCVGVDQRFIKTTTFGFSKVAWDLIDDGGSKDHDNSLVWAALNSGEFIILDGGMGGGTSSFGMPTTTYEVGENITLVAMNSTRYNMTVLAITKQFGISGVFMTDGHASELFGVNQKMVHLIEVKDGKDTHRVSDGLRRNLLIYGFYTIIIHDMVKLVLRSQNAFFDLFNAFLSLGLIIGVVGLGIVMLRSVYERRHEIGMMRAIGFKRPMVMGAFLGEASFISGSGLVIGAILGIVLGWILWRDEGFGSEFSEFGIPYVKISVILALAFLFAIVSSIAPSMKAARVVPAEALRYE